MVLGFIYARITEQHGGSTTIDARSPGCPAPASAAALEAAFAAVPDLADGEIKAEYLVVDVSNTIAVAEQPATGPAVVCIRTHAAPTDTIANMSAALNSSSSGGGAAAAAGTTKPTVVVTCLMSDTGVPTDVLRREASALNDFAGACINATSKSVCEAVFAVLLNPDDVGGGGAAQQQQRGPQATLLSAASRSPSGLPRCVVERAVPLAFCFVPPAALGGASMGESNEFLDRGPPPLLEERLKEVAGAMPWNRDDALTDHIVDVLRVCSAFVADALISDVPDLLESRFACELIPPHPAAAGGADPARQRAAVAAQLLSPSPSAQGAFFGRGVWFTGLFAADGAVVSATGGFFRLPIDEQVLVSALVAQCNAGGDMGDDAAAPEAAHFFPDVVGQIQKQQQIMPTTAARGVGGGGVHASALPPMMNVVETQVQFHPDTPNQAALRAAVGSASSFVLPPVEGSVVVFVIDDNLRFVVGVPRHQSVATARGNLSVTVGGMAQRTASEMCMWAQQLLDNSLQIVSSREVAKYCAAQGATDGGVFAACMSCCGAGDNNGGGGAGNGGVPSAGLRRLSYLTPGLLRHYSTVISASVARATRSCRYFSIGPDGSAPVRLLEAAGFSEFQQQGASPLRTVPMNTASASGAAVAPPRPVPLRYFVQVNRVLAASGAHNSAGARYALDDDGGGAAASSSPGQYYETAHGRPSSLLNAHPWREMLKFSDLVLLDSIAPVNALQLGVAASKTNFSVVSLASVGTSAATTAEQYQAQTTAALQSARAVAASLQQIAFAGIRAATTTSRVVLAAEARASHANPTN
jgi:hypothetical protein